MSQGRRDMLVARITELLLFLRCSGYAVVCIANLFTFLIAKRVFLKAGQGLFYPSGHISWSGGLQCQSYTVPPSLNYWDHSKWNFVAKHSKMIFWPGGHSGVGGRSNSSWLPPPGDNRIIQIMSGRKSLFTISYLGCWEWEWDGCVRRGTPCPHHGHLLQGSQSLLSDQTIPRYGCLYEYDLSTKFRVIHNTNATSIPYVWLICVAFSCALYVWPMFD